MIRKFAVPYARALMEVVTSPADAAQLLEKLRAFEAARASSAELENIYGNPAVNPETRLSVTRALARRLEIPDLGLRVLEVVVRNQRINQLGSILYAWKSMLDEAAGVSVAEVRSAHDLDPSEREKLRVALERRFGGRIDLQLSTDPSLLAGFVAQVGSEVYDASVSGRINKFRESLRQ